MAFDGKTTTKQKIIATNSSPQIHNHLKMYALYKDSTMSDIIMKLIKNHLKKKPSEKELVGLLAAVAYEEWDDICLTNANDKKWQGVNIQKRFEEWITNTKECLIKKEINEKVIKMIILEIEQMEINR